MNKAFAVLFIGLTACNYDAGECYVRGQEGGGVGGGVITPTGVGGFGDVPPKPQDASGPSDPSDPCSSQTAECTVKWKIGSEGCKEPSDSGCTTLFQCPHATLEDAKKQCELTYGVGNGSDAQSCGPCQWEKDDPVEKCKKVCDQQYEKCCKPCTTQSCYSACMDVYKECLKDCQK